MTAALYGMIAFGFYRQNGSILKAIIWPTYVGALLGLLVATGKATDD